MKSSARIRFIVDASFIFTVAWYSLSKAATVLLSSSVEEFEPRFATAGMMPMISPTMRKNGQ
jgi:hypothetical protein